MDYSKYCALTYNGVLLDDVIDGYTTINVDGRGLFSPSLNVVTVPGKDGGFVLDQQYPPKQITVYFLLKAFQDKVFRERLNKLHALLKSEEDVKFSFGDEKGYRLGRLSEVTNPPYNQNAGVGSFVLYCQKPFLYSDNKERNFTGSTSTIKDIEVDSLTITCDAPADNLKITDKKTGAQLLVLESFSEGDIVLIDFQNNRITKNKANITQKVDFTKSTFTAFKHPSGLELELSIESPATLVYREIQL